MALDVLGFGSPTVTTAVGPPAAPGSGRGFVVQLGKVTSVNLNSAAATTIFTTPAVGGYTRAVVSEVVIDNPSAAASTVSISYGASGTPTDWAATATMPGLGAVNKFVKLHGGVAATGSATYGVGVAFVANVTIPQGVATSCDISAWGWYE